MKLKDLISSISQDSGVPAGQVRKVTKALTQKLQALIEQQEGFRSGVLVFKPVTIPAKPASEGKGETAEKKLARVLIRPRKQKKERKGSREHPQD